MSNSAKKLIEARVGVRLKNDVIGHFHAIVDKSADTNGASGDNHGIDLKTPSSRE